MLTLDTISIKSDNRHDYILPHDRPEPTVPLIANQTICPPGLEEFLGRLSDVLVAS